jgi:hypothetical protein
MNVTACAHGDDLMMQIVPASARAPPNAAIEGVVGPLIEYGEQAASSASASAFM